MHKELCRQKKLSIGRRKPKTDQKSTKRKIRNLTEGGKRVDNPPDPGVVRSGFMSGKKNKSEWEQVIETGCFQLVDTVLGGAHP